ncbi:MAG: FAD-binding oxidoreductase [Candidatus Nanopelagicales bacterium]|nr:FAD-binding oxidoreductase [Candidatus Nanopelagicales bacterium]
MTQSLSQTFGRWGTPTSGPVSLTPRAAQYLAELVGTGAPANTATHADVGVAASRLTGEQMTSLALAIGQSHVSSGRAERLKHALGCSLTDYLVAREGGSLPAPDAVATPGSHEDVMRLLRVCADHRIQVVPFGGGTSVVGGVAQPAGDAAPSISIAFDRMAEVLGIDEVSCTVTVQPGITGPQLERVLSKKGFTLGHLPQSWERATIGGYVATRSAGQASTGYGRSDEMVESLRVATPTTELRLGRAPMSAAGPDLRQLFIGSEGAFGVITEITLRVRRVPVHTRYEGLMLPDYQAGIDAFREMAQLRLTADLMRLSDEPETATSMAMSGPGGVVGGLFGRYLELRNVSGGCMAILGWEGHSKRVMGARRAAAWAVLKKNGAASLGGSVGAAWRRHRFEGPYLRDELLDRGYIVETLETATHWSALRTLHDAVSAALKTSLRSEKSNPYVMCHVSHVYETGASLYFTVIAVAASDPIAQWHAAKVAATDAILANEGTVTHHHSVGRDHAPWLVQEIGEGGLAVLKSVKNTLDPSGVMNPGKLVPIA